MTKEAKKADELSELRTISVIRREFAEAEKKRFEREQEELAQKQWLDSPEGKVFQEVVEEEWVKKGMREKAFRASFYEKDNKALQKEVEDAKNRVAHKIVEKSLKVRGDKRTVDQYFADEYERLSGHKPMTDVRPYSGASIAEFKRNATEFKRGDDENLHPMSGADGMSMLKHYPQPLVKDGEVDDLAFNPDLFKKVYAFANGGKEPAPEDITRARIVAKEQAKFDIKRGGSSIPAMLAKSVAPKGNTMARETVRE